MTPAPHTCRRPPTERQLKLIPKLCQERGVSFDAPPTSFRQADERIKALLAVPRMNGDRIEDREAVEEGFGDFGGACAVREDEIDGFGSTARWASRTLDESCW